VKRHFRILVLFLLTGVLGGFAVPRVDRPGTSYDESDSPTNLAPPSQAGLSSVRSVVARILVSGLRFCRVGCFVSGRVRRSAAMPRQRYPHFLQNLLCTFLI
jgi:hypothetical protein